MSASRNQPLYKWQKECLNIWNRNKGRGIIRAVTGAGKTRLALAAMDSLVEQYSEVYVRIVVPTIPLADQWKTALLHHVSSEEYRPGLYGGGKYDDAARKVMIYIINSARDTLASHIRRDLSLNRHVFLICDECHHCQSSQNRIIFDFLNQKVLDGNTYHCMGLSATPFGTENDGILIRSLGEEIYRYDFEDAGRDAVIAPFTVGEVSTSFFPEERIAYRELTDKIRILLKKLQWMYPKLSGMSKNQFMKALTVIAHKSDMNPSEPAALFLLLAYERKKITSLARARISCALSLLKELPEDKRILIFCERIEQAEEMAETIRLVLKRRCAVYHSKMQREARKRILEEFRNGAFKILCACRCLDEGIDVPDADIGIILSSSSVERQRVQRLGRVLRNAPGKASACVYYIYIRDAAEDCAYLPELKRHKCFSIRYYTEEGTFSNELYEYVADDILKHAKEKNMSAAYFDELRKCLVEGLVRADYLQTDLLQRKMVENAAENHEKNYWNVMRRIGKEFRAPKAISTAGQADKTCLQEATK